MIKMLYPNLKFIFEAVKNHLLSDVNVGLFLSGGTDSTALAHKISDQMIKRYNNLYLRFC